MIDEIEKSILTVLQSKDMYGLEILESIKELTDGKINLTQPKLYSYLLNLQNENLILSFWQEEDGIKLHYYSLSNEGKQLLKNDDKTNSLNEILGDSTHNEIIFPDIQDDDDNDWELEDEENDDNQENEEEQEIDFEELNRHLKEEKDDKKKEEIKPFFMISNISERQTKKKNDLQAEAEEIQASFENNFENKKTKLEKETPIKIEKKYLLINKIKVFSSLWILCFDLIAILAFCLIFYMNNDLYLEQIIIAIAVSILCLLGFLTMFIPATKQKNKKIGIKIHWIKKLFLRIISTSLLVAFAISVSLLLGASNIFEPVAIFRWAVPTILFINIILDWFFVFLLSKNKKYIAS